MDDIVRRVWDLRWKKRENAELGDEEKADAGSKATVDVGGCWGHDCSDMHSRDFYVS